MDNLYADGILQSLKEYREDLAKLQKTEASWNEKRDDYEKEIAILLQSNAMLKTMLNRFIDEV